MIICVCKSVSDHQIKSAVEVGATTYESLQETFGVGTQCGSCACEVKDVLQQAKMKGAKKNLTACQSALSSRSESQVVMTSFPTEVEAPLNAQHLD